MFLNQAGPVKITGISTNTTASTTSKKTKENENTDGGRANGIEDSDEDEEMHDVSEDAIDEGDAESAADVVLTESVPEGKSRKRKRNAPEDHLEDAYMRRLAKEEEKEVEKRRTEKAKRRKTASPDDDDDESSTESDGNGSAVSDDEEVSEPPVHESLSGVAKSDEVEKSNRTIFLGNVSTEAIRSKSAKKTLLKHLASFFSSLPESTPPHKVESIRFRSTPFASGGGIPKRASYARKEVLDETTPSTNAYVVYSTVQAARKAPAALNGTVVLDRHLRVDSVAHPSETDHKRCVFVGNLAFVDLETDPDADDPTKKKRKKPAVPADIEEGLWRTFNAHTGRSNKASSISGRGSVESVRVVRDPLTRVGKGFAYVQFYDENCVEEALLLDGKKFPPMLPRNLRVSRAKKVRKKSQQQSDTGRGASRKAPLGVGSAQKTLQGRAARLLGRAGAAQLKSGSGRFGARQPFVFEGKRASEDGARIKVKTKSRGAKGKGKPKNRSSKRAAAFRASGGQAAKSAR